MHGIILNDEMNKQIETAFTLFEDGDYESSEKTFKNLISNYSDYPYGFLHLNLIQLLLVQEKMDEARQYLEIIRQSNFSDKAFIIDQLKKTQLFSN